jgi:phospholipid/cholesterol/gamma-HCH transport system permease protein
MADAAVIQPPRGPQGLIIGLSRRMGQNLLSGVHFAGGLGMLTVQVCREILTPPFYFNLTVQQIYSIGTRSIILVAITALCTGTVMALQFGYGLAKFGGTLYVPKLVALSILREMGPVFTSLLVAGRIGSGIASEIASMKVTQQIDAIRALGTSPIKRIVIPRMVACLIALPILCVFADYIGMMGAMAISMSELHINSEYFITKAVDTLRLYDLFTGMAKTIVFAYFMSITACWKGLNTEGGTEGVGNSTTWVVVTSFIFIMISDVFLTKLFILTVLPKNN